MKLKIAAKRMLLRLFNPNKPMSKDRPTSQTMIDLFKGEWASKFPPPFDDLQAGEVPVFEDTRVAWAIEQIGGVKGLNILELGPMEAGHTYMLEKAGAEKIVAIEANPQAFLRCLIVKEILGLSRTRFLFGDFMKYFEAESPHFDAAIASGVLYHMADPVGLIMHLGRSVKNVYIWTHYYDKKFIDRIPKLAECFSHHPGSQQGFDYRVHQHTYVPAFRAGRFRGGVAEFSVWLERDALVGALKHAGFDRIEIQFDEPGHPHGPCISLLARRKTAP